MRGSGFGRGGSFRNGLDHGLGSNRPSGFESGGGFGNRQDSSNSRGGFKLRESDDNHGTSFGGSGLGNQQSSTSSRGGFGFGGFKSRDSGDNSGFGGGSGFIGGGFKSRESDDNRDSRVGESIFENQHGSTNNRGGFGGGGFKSRGSDDNRGTFGSDQRESSNSRGGFGSGGCIKSRIADDSRGFGDRQDSSNSCGGFGGGGFKPRESDNNRGTGFGNQKSLTSSRGGFGVGGFKPRDSGDNSGFRGGSCFGTFGGGGGFGKSHNDFGEQSAFSGNRFPPSGGFESRGRPERNRFGGEQSEEHRLPNNYVPEVRNIDELYKEDADHAENYRQIVDDDDEIHVSGPNIEHTAILDTWLDAKFDEVLLKNITERAKYIRPRKIQAHVIPLIMNGRDVKGHAETGSGKTAAFMLPIIQNLISKERTGGISRPSPYAIVIEPTRELCSQVYEQGRKLADGTGVIVAKAYGQYCMRENLRELQLGCDILCSTPGRLRHLITSNLIDVANVKYVVLDEADKLLEDNFLDDVREIFNVPNFPDKQSRQTMLFSATFPESVQILSADVLREDNVMVSNRKPVAANSKVIQQFKNVSADQKKQVLLEMLQEEIEEQRKKQVKNPTCRRTLVFVETKRNADLISIFLCEKGIKATTINGDRSQNLREKALRDFRNNDVWVLVSTDVCARGIDIKDLDHVINMDLPNDEVTYVHRIGRTGRLNNGLATSFFDEYSSNDTNIAKKLVEFVRGVEQVPPDFLVKIVEGSSTSGFFSSPQVNNFANAGQPGAAINEPQDDYTTGW